MKVKRLISSILITLMMASSLAACGGSTEATQKSEGTTVAADKTSTGGTEKSAEKKTFTFYMGFEDGKLGNPGDTKIGKMIEDKLGVHIEYERLVGDGKVKIGTMTAAGEYPDLIWGHEDHKKFIEAGACIPLDDYIEKFGTNIKKVYGDTNLAKLKDVYGETYYISPYREDKVLKNPSVAWYIQRAVLKEFNWPKITTMEEYFDILEKYALKYPKINGLNTIAFTTLTDGWRFFTLTNPPSFLSGFPNDGNVYVNKDTLEAKVFFNSDKISKPYYKKLNEMYNNGLLDKTAFTDNYDKYIQKLSSGNVLGFHDQEWQIQTAQDALANQKMDDRMYVPIPVLYDGVEKDQYVYASYFTTRDGVSISKNCKDPEGAFKFIDALLAEDIQKLIHWGIEGEDYLVDGNGKFYRTEEIRAKVSDREYATVKQGIGCYDYPWPHGTNVQKYADGNPWYTTGSTDEIKAEYKDGDRAVLKAYNVDVYTQLFDEPSTTSYGFAWEFDSFMADGSEAKIAFQKMDDVNREWIVKAIIGSASQFEKNWEKYKQEFEKTNYQAYEKFVTEKLKEKAENNKKYEK